MERKLSSLEVLFYGIALNPLQKAIKNHVETHSSVTFVDVVKFLYQSVLGSFHMLDHMDDQKIETWIRESLAPIEPAARMLTEKLYGEKWVRLDLGAFKQRYGNDYKTAAQLFTKGRLETRVSQHEFTILIVELVKLVKDGMIRPVDSNVSFVALVERFLDEYKKMGYPPLHHSEIYSKNNVSYIVVPASNIRSIE